MNRDLDDDRWVCRFGLAFFVVVTAAVYARAFFAVDLTDDAYYAALPWSFVQGRTPLVDEWAIQQLGAILVWPAFEAYVGWMGSSDGIILFQRHLHIAASVGVALCVRWALARMLGPRLAWPLAAMAVAYVPFHLQALSYNTIAELGLLAGLFTLGMGVYEPGRGLRVGGAAVFFALASFAYPPIALPCALAVGLAVAATFHLHGASAGWRSVIAVGAVGVPVVAAVATWLMASGGTEAYAGMRDLDASLAAQGGGARKLQSLAAEFELEAVFLSVLLSWLGGVVLLALREWSPRMTLGLTLALAFAPFALHPLYVDLTEPHTSAPFYASGLALISPVVVQRVARVRGRTAGLALGVIVVPSVVAVITIVWATANGLRNAALGALPAAIVALACVGWLVDRRMQGLPLRSPVALGIVVSLISLHVVQLWTTSYRNGPVSGLTARMESGPWQGIHTTPERKQVLEQLQADLARHAAGASSLFVFDYLPGAYLLSPLRPMTVSLWTFSEAYFQGTLAARYVYLRAFRLPDRRPDLILENHCMFGATGMLPFQRPLGLPPDPLRMKLLRTGYETVASQDCYTLYRAVDDGKGERPPRQRPRGRARNRAR